MDEEIEPHNTFILFWDCYGLEACHDLTNTLVEAAAVDRANLFERIKSPDEEPHNAVMAQVGRILQISSLRARYNTQRNYELYMIQTDTGITKQTLVDAFQENPQGTAELIRDRGQKLFSYRNENERTIT